MGVIRSTGGVLAVMLLTATAGCHAEPAAPQPPAHPSPARSPAAKTAPSALAAGAVCPSTATYLSEAAGDIPEVQGAGDGASLWALLFLTRPELHAGVETKIVWRMTGAGELTMRASGPEGATTRPVWGPEPHGGSTWSRPGDEWGTGWTFPTAGCWTVHASRAGGGTGYLVFRVAP